MFHLSFALIGPTLTKHRRLIYLALRETTSTVSHILSGRTSDQKTTQLEYKERQMKKERHMESRRPRKNRDGRITNYSSFATFQQNLIPICNAVALVSPSLLGEYL